MEEQQSALCDLASLVSEQSQEQSPTLDPENTNRAPTRYPRQAPEELPLPLGAPAWKAKQQQFRDNAQSVQ